MKILIAFLVLLITAPALADSRTDVVDKLFAQFDTMASPGCAVGVSQNGRVIYEKAYGMADLERNVRLNTDSVFDVGSIGKQFTAASVVLLAQQGKLKFTDSVRKYVPELPAYFDRVTIDHLIHHTSGMVEVGALVILIRDGLGQQHISDLEAEARDGQGDYHMSNDEFIQLMSRLKSLNFQPGEQSQYTNSGYILLAEIVKRASGKALPLFAKENIFDPLGMKNTKFVDDHAELIKNRAVGYMPRRSGGFLIDSGVNDLIGDGGLYSTIEDMLRWNHNFDTGQVGGPEFLKTMLTLGKLNSGKTFGYASGLSLLKYRGLDTVGHGGANHAYWNDSLRFPDQQFAVVCMCNTFTDTSNLTREIAKVYLGDKMTDDPAATDSPAMRRPTIIDLKGVDLGEYAGDYHSDELQVTFRFIVENNQLKLFGRKSNDPAAYPIAVDHFFFKPGMELAFARDAQKHVTGFTLSIRDTNWTAPASNGLTFNRVQH
jgi:CubicO group peptidase (beta-lactamase class C family)